MDRHRPRLHPPTQGSAAGVPYPASASLRSWRESKMPRRKDPQHPPPPGGAELPAEKRPKFVSVAWGWGRSAQVPGSFDFSEGGGSPGPGGLHFVLGFQSCRSLNRFTMTHPVLFGSSDKYTDHCVTPGFLRRFTCVCVDLTSVDIVFFKSNFSLLL